MLVRCVTAQARYSHGHRIGSGGHKATNTNSEFYLAGPVAHVARNAFYPHAVNGIGEELEFLTSASLA